MRPRAISTSPGQATCALLVDVDQVPSIDVFPKDAVHTAGPRLTSHPQISDHCRDACENCSFLARICLI
jgi:hypothetical protein